MSRAQSLASVLHIGILVHFVLSLSHRSIPTLAPSPAARPNAELNVIPPLSKNGAAEKCRPRQYYEVRSSQPRHPSKPHKWLEVENPVGVDAGNSGMYCRVHVCMSLHSPLTGTSSYLCTMYFLQIDHIFAKIQRSHRELEFACSSSIPT